MIKQATILYRMPGEIIPKLLSGPALDEKPPGEGFCFVPFGKNSKPVYLAGQAKHLSTPLDVSLLAPMEEASDMGKQWTMHEHSAMVEEAVGAIRLGVAEKIVMAGRFVVQLSGGVSVAGLFDALSHAYPDAFVYCFRSDESGTWIGATPELLLRTRGELGNTMALAGTRKKGVTWSEKEIEEQEIVADYITDVLKNRGVHYVDSLGPMDLNYGHLRHLNTEISYAADNHPEILSDLFPTPAICGRPTDAARSYLDAHEPFSREYYCGYLGTLESNGDMTLFVNLRCMKLFKNAAMVYAGGGITAKSDPMAEAEEVMNKVKAVTASLEESHLS